jgi:pyruvate kinase
MTNNTMINNQETMTKANHSRAQIVATLGPSTNDIEHIRTLAKAGMDVARLNFSWGSFDEHAEQIERIRQVEKEIGREILILEDIPGPRIQENAGHTYDHGSMSALTPHDRECIVFGIEKGIDFIAQSFVGNAKDVLECKEYIKEKGGNQQVIAKIERAVAVENLDEIVAVADGLMVARGDLGNEVPLEKIPFVQEDIIKKANMAGKPVITATQMMLSMTDSATPTRAEVTDVENAIVEGSDAVMLSEETAKGNFPLEAVSMMERIIVESEKHVSKNREFNLLKRLGDK